MECAGKAKAATALSGGWQCFGLAEDLRAFRKRCRAALAAAVQNGGADGTRPSGRFNDREADGVEKIGRWAGLDGEAA